MADLVIKGLSGPRHNILAFYMKLNEIGLVAFHGSDVWTWRYGAVTYIVHDWSLQGNEKSKLLQPILICQGSVWISQLEMNEVLVVDDTDGLVSKIDWWS